MKTETKRVIQKAGVLLFIVYILLLIYVLFFSEGYGRTVQEEQIYRYNLVPFAEISRFWIYREQLGITAFLTNIFGNILCFVPYGLILPVIFRRMQSGCLIVLSGFGLSLCVEVIQLAARVGSFDVDDLILNTAGAALGYLVFVVCDRIRRNHHGKKI